MAEMNESGSAVSTIRSAGPPMANRVNWARGVFSRRVRPGMARKAGSKPESRDRGRAQPAGGREGKESIGIDSSDGPRGEPGFLWAAHDPSSRLIIEGRP